MGQKVNPHGLRVGIIKDWDSRWFVKHSEFGKTLFSDYNLRKYLKKTLFDAKVPKIEIERDNQRVRIIIHCAMPGKVIGRGGGDIEKLKEETCRILERPSGEVSVNVVEVKYPDLNAQLVAENIADQLEKRVSFRKAMKQAMGRTMKFGAKGIKIAVSGLLGGADIARTEHYHEGTIPLQTIRADIDYGHYAALTKMGLIGIKVWIYKGEVLTAVKRDAKTEADRSSRVRENVPPRRERPQRSSRDSDDDKQAFMSSDRGDRGDRGDRNDRNDNRGGRPYQPRDNSGNNSNNYNNNNNNRSGGYNRPPRADGQQGGGFNRDNRGGGNRNRDNDRQSSPPVNFGNRKPGFQRNQPKRPRTEEADASNAANTANIDTETVKINQTEGGNGDVNA